MRMSTKGRYGLRVMIELARISKTNPGCPVMLSTLAKVSGISRKYLHSLLTILKKAGLVQAVRGVSGGFLLTRDPKTIVAVEIIEPLEGPLDLVDCVQHPECCDRAESCLAREVWTEAARALRQVLAEKTLAQMAKAMPGGHPTRPRSKRSVERCTTQDRSRAR